MGSPITTFEVEPPSKQAKFEVEPPTKVDRGWTDSVIDFAKEAWNKVNPWEGLKGTAQATSHPIDTLKNDASARQKVYDMAEKSFKQGDYTGGAAHLLYSMIPLMGPSLESAGEQFQRGEYAKGAGASVGMGLNLALPGALKNANIRIPNAGRLRAAAEDLYQSSLKPSTAGNPIKAAIKNKANIATGLENEIPVSAGGAEKLAALIDDVNAKMDAAIPKGSTATVNRLDVASRLGDVGDRFRTQVNPESDLAAIQSSGEEFMRTQPRNIPVEDAAALKSGTYTQLRGKYGELKSAQIESQKALARGIKEELIQQFPELKSLGIQDKALLDLQPALEKAVQRVGNHQVIGIGTPIAAAGVKAISKSSGLAATAATLKAVIDNPFIKSHLAFALAKASKGKGITVPPIMRVQGYVNALGQAANAANGETGDGQSPEQ